MARTIQTNGPESITEVVTSGVGMTSGDLIYLRNGDYGAVPNAATSSVAFPISEIAYGTATGKQGLSKTLVNIRGTSWGGANSAILSNGNIVYSYAKRPNNGTIGNLQLYFQVRDSSDNTVVAETVVSQSSTYPYQPSSPTSCATVCEFSGGGFLVVYRDNSGYMVAQAYNNSGVSQGTYRSASAFLGNGNASRLNQVKTSTNTVAIAYANNPNAYLNWIVFSNTAMVVSGPTTPSTSAYAYYGLIFDIAIRPTDNYIMVIGTNSGNQIYWFLYDTTYTLASSGTLTSIGNATAVSLTSLPNGRFALVASVGSNITINYFETSGSWGSWALLPRLTTSFANPYYTQITGLAGNKLLTVTQYDYQFPVICIYDTSTYAPLISPVMLMNNSCMGPSAGAYAYSGASYYKGTIVGNEVWLIDNGFGFNHGNNGFSGLSRIKINTSTNLFVSADTYTTQTVGTGNALPGNYSRSTSTPSAASFQAASTGTISSVILPSSTTLSNYPVAPIDLSTLPGLSAIAANTACYQILLTPSGNFLVLVMVPSGLQPLVGILLSSTGSLINTYTLIAACGGGTSYVGQGFKAFYNEQNHLIITTRNPSNNSNIDVNVFDTSFAVLYSRPAALTGFDYWTNQYDGIAMCPMPYPNMIAVAGGDNATANLKFFTYNYATNSISFTGSYASGIGGTAYAGTTLAASPSGFIVVTYQDYVAGNWYESILILGENDTSTAGTAYTQWTNTNFSNNYSAQSGVAIVMGNGYIANVSPQTTNTNSTVSAVGGNSSFYSTQTYPSYFTTYSPGYPLAATAEGVMCTIMPTNNDANATIRTTVLSLTAYVSTTENSSLTGASSLINFNNNLWTSSGGISICAGLGRTFAAVIRDSSTGTLKFFVIKAPNYTATTTLTAGVSTSAANFALNPSTGYVLKGVALETVSAGNAGRILTQGSTQLNANYSASTAAQTFNFENRATSGAQGSIVGRNITFVRKDA